MKKKNSKVEIIAGPPGTGKTTYLLSILEEELKHYEPNEIAFVSFTRTGTYEGRDRAMQKFNYKEDDLPYFRTLQSLAFREMKARQTEMFNNNDRKRLGKLIGYNFNHNFTADLNNNDSVYLFYIDAYRNNPRLGRQIVESGYINSRTLLEIETNYKNYKREFSKLDYTDLILEFVKRNNPLPVKVAIVDEAQDLTTLQWDMVDIAFRDCDKIYIAGDDDQAIYEWSGADVGRFIKAYGNLTILKHSYRLPRNILEFSKTISNNISNRIDKDFEPATEGGDVKRIREDLIEEFTNNPSVQINPDESYLFLSRNRFYLDLFKTALIRVGAPFKIEGKTFHDKSDIDAINTYTRLQRGLPSPQVRVNALKRYLINPKMNPNEHWYTALKLDEEHREYYRMVIQNKADMSKDPQIDIRTIHSVKGAEVDHVFLHLNITSAVKRNLQYNPDSEHRVFYVGATRAKKSLTIVLPDQRNYYDIDFRWIRSHELLEKTNIWGTE